MEPIISRTSCLQNVLNQIKLLKSCLYDTIHFHDMVLNDHVNINATINLEQYKLLLRKHNEICELQIILAKALYDSIKTIPSFLQVN
jgi:hypothetical protein